jgi:hypothetical protein
MVAAAQLIRLPLSCQAKKRNGIPRKPSTYIALPVASLVSRFKVVEMALDRVLATVKVTFMDIEQAAAVSSEFYFLDIWRYNDTL